MPKQKPESQKFKTRVIVNSDFENVQSSNWKLDYKRFTGMSYADVVKCRISATSTVNSSTIVSTGSAVKNKTSTRTWVPTKQVKELAQSNPLTKPSDVHYTLTRSTLVKGKRDRIANHVDGADIELHNRFDVLNNIQDIDSPVISNISDIESHVNVHNEPCMEGVSYVNTGKRAVKAKVIRSNVNTEGKDALHVAGTVVKNCQKYDTKITGKNASKDIVLKETEDKYDLELRFKPKYRQRISEAKHVNTFKNWDNQMQDKYGFVPLGNILVPERDNKNPNIQDIKILHETVKKSKNFNFTDTQIQIHSQLNPDIWEKYLNHYWDKQLCYLIRYGFPLDHKQESPLSHDFKNHNTAIEYEDDVKAYLQEEKKVWCHIRPL